MEDLVTVPESSKLYNVYGYDSPKDQGGNKTMIGTLKLNGKLVSSKWGDENLFF